MSDSRSKVSDSICIDWARVEERERFEPSSSAEMQRGASNSSQMCSTERDRPGVVSRPDSKTRDVYYIPSISHPKSSVCILFPDSQPKSDEQVGRFCVRWWSRWRSWSCPSHAALVALDYMALPLMMMNESMRVAAPPASRHEWGGREGGCDPRPKRRSPLNHPTPVHSITWPWRHTTLTKIRKNSLKLLSLFLSTNKYFFFKGLAYIWKKKILITHYNNL